MPQERKIIISDNDPAFLQECQRALAKKGIRAVLVPRSGPELWTAILREEPQAVVCNLFMAGCDAVHIIEELRRLSSRSLPVFAALSTGGSDCLFQRFLEAGGSYLFIKPVDPTLLAVRMADILTPHTELSIPGHTQNNDSAAQAAAQMLRSVGVPAHLTGYRCLRTGLILLTREPDRFKKMQQLYEAIAAELDCSIRCVERNIRTAVEAACDRGDREIFSALFGSSVSRRTGKPKNVQFITALYEQLSCRVSAEK